MADAHMYILADGRDVPENSPLARFERECLAEDINALRAFGRDSDGRAGQLAKIHRSMGNAYAARLRAAYEEDRERRRAARQNG